MRSSDKVWQVDMALHQNLDVTVDPLGPIVPQKGEMFLQKVRHSAFYATSLAYLLRTLEPNRLILTGQVTEQCVLYSALDGYVRHFEMVVPRTAVAHIHDDLADAALRMMHENMRAQVAGSVDEALEAACA